ncbi:MAG: hypothetical protein FWC79_08820, partial [Oscillospiraceae bacterium]|nr:hypothetical protein [Oscillospiraceae bacterium]
MLSSITLTGSYTNNNDEVVTINATRQARVIWDASELNREDTPARLNSEIITNEIVNIDGVNKRVVQARVTSGISNNIYPIRETTIQIDAPIGVLEEIIVEDTELLDDETIPNVTMTEVLPESITVATFGNMNWTYEELGGNISITIDNRPDDNNVIQWNRSGLDEFIVTYIFAEEVDASAIELNMNSTIILHDEMGSRLTASYEMSEANLGSLNIVSFNSAITREGYRSILTVGQNLEHNSIWAIGVSYAPAIDSIVLSATGNALYNGDVEIANVNVEYLSTNINREDFLRMFGQDGELRIYVGNAYGEELFTTVTANNSVDENGNIVINYEEGTTSLRIVTSSPETEGRLNIRHTRVLNGMSASQEEFSSATYMVSRVNAQGRTAENEYVQMNIEDASEMRLVAPVSVANLEMSRTNLSTVNSNEVRFTITLNTNHYRYDLYTNPVFTIELPGYVRTLGVRDIDILSGNGLE